MSRGSGVVGGWGGTRADAIKMLLSFLKKQSTVPWPVTQDHNKFRQDQLYTEAVDSVRRPALHGSHGSHEMD